MIYTRVIPLTHHLWLISRIRTRFRQYPRIDYFGNLWRYHGFRWFWRDIVEFFIFAFDDAIFRNWSFHWRWLAFEHFPDFADIEYFLILLQCCTRDMMISIIFLQLMMWRYSALGLIILLLMTSTINRLLWRYPVIWAFLCSLTISRIFRFISFPLIYLDFVHFRPFVDN
jgi:hypothetical protein